MFFEIREATPFAERGRQAIVKRKGVAQKKRHCQSGKNAFESAKLAKVFGQLNFDELLAWINKAQKPNKKTYRRRTQIIISQAIAFLGFDFEVFLILFGLVWHKSLRKQIPAGQK